MILLNNRNANSPNNATSAADESSGAIVAAISTKFLDETGKVVSDKPEQYVPHIDVTIPALIEGERLVDPAIRSTLALINEFSRSELAVERVTIYNDNYIELSLSDQTRIVCSTKCDPFLVVSTLRSIHSAYTIEGRLLDTVDFRFSKPFIVERYGT